MFCRFEYSFVHIFLHCLSGISLYIFLLFLQHCLICFLVNVKLHKWQNALPLLCFYTFKTLCFYSKLPVCKPDFLFCLNTFFTTCPKTIRQIKRMICPLIAVWQCLAFKGSVWHCYTIQCFRKQGFTLYNDFY